MSEKPKCPSCDPDESDVSDAYECEKCQTPTSICENCHEIVVPCSCGHCHKGAYFVEN